MLGMGGRLGLGRTLAMGGRLGLGKTLGTAVGTGRGGTVPKSDGSVGVATDGSPVGATTPAAPAIPWRSAALRSGASRLLSPPGTAAPAGFEAAAVVATAGFGPGDVLLAVDD
jgi:hypothetical protein